MTKVQFGLIKTVLEGKKHFGQMVILLQVLEMQMKKLFKNTLKNKEMNNYADSWQPLKMVAFSRLYNINLN